MKRYDPASPLIFIHVPKTAGTSVRGVFKRWYGSGFLEHYFDERAGRLPGRHQVDSLPTQDPVVIYGHFNRLRGFGIEDYYPQVDQFVTILRDPFETAISGYYYLRKNESAYRDKSRIPQSDLRQYLIATPPNILNHFPRTISTGNYKILMDEMFVAVGVTERLSDSMAMIAAGLGMPFDRSWLRHENATPRDQPAPQDLRQWYEHEHPLEYDVYRYALERLGLQDIDVPGSRSS